MNINEIQFCPKCGTKLKKSENDGFYCPNTKCKILTDLIIKKPRDKWEILIDRHNHKLEVVRTIGNVIGGIAGSLAILRIMGII